MKKIIFGLLCILLASLLYADVANNTNVKLSSIEHNIKYNWVDASLNGDLIAISRYGVSTSIKLPFEFLYNNEKYEYLLISKDGWIGLSKKAFYPENEHANLANQPKKDQVDLIITALPYNQFKAVSTDVYYLVTKYYVAIEWRNWKTAEQGGTSQFEILLHPKGIMKIQYHEMKESVSQCALQSFDYITFSKYACQFDANERISAPVAFSIGKSKDEIMALDFKLIPFIYCNQPLAQQGTGTENDFSTYNCSSNTYAGGEKIYLLDITSTTNVKIKISNFGTRQLDVFLLSAYDANSCITGGQDLISVDNLEVGEYYVVVDGLTAGDDGTFDVQSTCNNLTCTDAIELPNCNDFILSGDTTLTSAKQTKYGCSLKNYPGNEQIYHFNLSTPQNIYVNVNEPGMEGILLSECQAQSCASAGSRFEKYNAPAGDYYLVVDSTMTGGKPYTGLIDCGSRMNCAQAETISCEDTRNGTTTAGINNNDLYSCSGTRLLSGKEKVYVFQNTQLRNITATLTNLQADLDVFILSGCNEGSCQAWGDLSATGAMLQAGTYYIVVDGVNGAESDFSLTLNCQSPAYLPPYSNCFESGDDFTKTGFWHVVDHPTNIFIPPPVNTFSYYPDYPDLYMACEGNRAYWYGEDSTGTFIGAYNPNQPPGSGGTSYNANSGYLITPVIDLTHAPAAQLNFKSWWEVEGVDVDRYDMMYVDVSVNGGAWINIGKLNPLNDVDGAPPYPYSSDGFNLPITHCLGPLFELSPYIGNRIQIRFRFQTNDQLYNAFRGWLVDCVNVTGEAIPDPIITSVDPVCNVLPTTILHIYGQHFENNATVSFDGIPAANVAVISSDEIQANIPTNLNCPGPIDITVDNPGPGGVATFEDAFMCGSGSCLPFANAGLDKAICEGHSVQIGGSPTAKGGQPPYIYLWVPAAGLNNATLANPTANPSATTTYTVTVTDSASQTDSDSCVVTVKTPPDSIFGSNSPRCLGSQTCFTDQSTMTPTSWFWEFGDGIGSSTQQNPCYTYATTGTYGVSLIANNECGNGSTYTANVQVTNIPTANFVSNSPQCKGPSGGIICFSDTSTNNPTGWSWNFGDGSGTSTQQNPCYAYTNAGIYTVTLTVSNGCGTNNPVTKSVEVRAKPVSSFLSDQPQCVNTAVHFTDMSSYNPTNWSWNFGDGVGTSTDQNPSYAYNVPGNYFASLIVSNECGSSLAFISQIEISNIPVADFTSNSPQCLGNAITFTDASSGNPTSWHWDFGDGVGTSTQQNPIYTYQNPGIYEVRLISYNSCGTSNTAKKKIIINQKPIANFSSKTTECMSVPINFFDTSNGNPTSWLWNFGDGSTSTQQNPTHAFSAEGNFSVTLTATNNCGTSTPIIKAVQVVGPAIASFTSNSPRCLGSTMQFTSTSSGNIANWHWNFGDGSTSTEQNPAHLYTNAGTYMAKLVVDNSCGSSAPFVATVTVVGLPAPSFTHNAPKCSGSEVSFYNTTQGNITSWLWNFGDGATSTQQNPHHTYSGPGTYTVTLTATNECNLSAQTSMPVVILGTPTAAWSSNAPKCFGTAVNFTDNSTQIPTSWQWNFGDGRVSNSQNPTHIYLDRGTYTVSLIVSNACGTSSPTTGSVTITGPPVTDFASNAPRCSGSPVQFTDTSTGNPATWLWNFGQKTETSWQVTDPLEASNNAVTSNLAPAFTITTPASAVSLDWAALTCGTGTLQSIFMSDGSSTTGWTISGDVVSNNADNNTCSGGGAGNNFRLRNGPSEIRRVISTAGYTGIDMRFDWWARNNWEASDCLQVWWSSDGGTNWTGPVFEHCGNTGNGSWNCTQTITFPVAADNNANFAIRFRVTTNDNTEYARVDHIHVEGHLPVCNVTTNTKVELVGPLTTTVLKNFGQPDNNPYTTEALALYNHDGPGTYRIRLTENSGHTATITGCAMNVLGGSIGTSTLQNPTFTFNEAGPYTVTLTTTNACGTSNQASHVINIIKIPTASFTSDSPRCAGPITFKDTSSDLPVSWIWNFGDGATSTQQNPTHTYAADGTYTVTLTVTNGCGTSTPFTASVTQSGTLGSGFSRWDVCEFARTPSYPVYNGWNANNTLYTDTHSKSWEYNDCGYCRFDQTSSNGYNSTMDCPTSGPLPAPCTFAMYIVADCGSSIKIPLYDVEGGTLKIYNVFGGYYESIKAVSEYGWSQGPATTITWQDSDCVNGDDANWNNVVTTVTLDPPGDKSVCGVYRLEFVNWAGFIWDLYSNCNGTSTEGFMIYDNICEALAAYHPYPELSVSNIHVSGDCPNFDLNMRIKNTGCTTVNAPVRITSTLGGQTNLVVTDVSPDESKLVNTSLTVTTCQAGTITVSIDPDNTVPECAENVDTAVACFVPPKQASVNVNIDEQCTTAPTFSGVFEVVDINPCADTGVRISWPSASNWGSATSGTYRVYRNGTQIASGITDLFFIDNSGTNGITYNYRVEAISDVCNLTDGNTATLPGVDNISGFAPVVSFVHNAPKCVGQGVSFTDTSTNNPTSWSWNFGDGSGSSTQQNPTYAYSAPGIYTVTLIASNGCGAGSPHTTTVTIRTAPVSSFTASPEICLGQSIAFTDTSTNNPYSWSWNFGDGIGSSTQQNPTYTYSAPGTYTVTLIASNICGNGLPFTFNVTVKSAPLAAMNFSSPQCARNPVQFTDVSTNNPTTWQWNFGDGATSNEKNPVHSYNTEGTYLVTLIASNSCGTSTPTTGNIEIITSAPVASFDSNAPQCLGNPISFTDTSTGAATAWQWNFGDGSTSTEKNPVHTYAAPGDYYVTLVVSSNCGISLPFSRIVSALSAPTASFIDDGPKCANNIVHFTDTSTGGATAWQWNFGDGQGTSNVQNPTYTYASPGNYTVTLIASNNCGQSVQFSKIINISGVPVASFTSTAPQCEGVAVSFVDTSSPSATSWQWDFGDGNTSNTQNPIHAYLTHGTYTVTLTPSNLCGQSIPYSRQILVLSNPNTDFTSNAPKCKNSLVQFTDVTSGNPTSWSWNFGDGSGSSTEQNPSYIYAIAGTYNVTLNTSNACGLGNQRAKPIEILSAPVANFLSDSPQCLGAAIHFTDLSTGYPTAWNWDFGDASGTSTLQNPSYIYAQPGNYTVTLEVSALCGTSIPVQKTVTVRPKPVSSFNTNAPKCFGTDIQFADASTDNPTSWSWDFGDGIGTSNLQNPAYSYANPGTYTVTLIASNGCGQGTMYQKQIQVLDKPTVMFSNDAPKPSGVAVHFVDQSTNVPTQWNWDFGDNGTSPDQNPAYIYAATGIYTVKLTAANDCGVGTPYSTTVQITASVPEADFTDDEPKCLGEPVQFFDLSLNNPTSWSWDFGDSSTSTEKNPQHIYASAGTYQVILVASNANGASQPKSKVVHINDGAPIVSFADNSPQCLGTAIQFTDASSNQPLNWTWDFGDSSGTSTEQNPSYIYQEAGTYTVNHNASNGCGIGTLVTSTVQVNGAKFISDSPKCDGQAVAFTDQSIGNVTGWLWNFGDNTGQSNTQNPTHTYAAPGEYIVTLTTAGNCSVPSIFSRKVYIGSSAPVGNFSSNAPTCSTLEIKFYDFSTNAPAEWDWDFGDGSPHSHEQNPVHVYPASGMYTVVLVASNGCGTSAPVSKQIVASNSGAVTAGFYSNSPVCYHQGPVQFTDTSAGSPTSWLWNFGDGGTSTAQNPSHTYSNAGNFIVTLTASNSCSQSQIIHQVTVAVNAIDADFTFNSNQCQGAPVQFTDATLGGPTYWDWDFGDGSSHSHLQNPKHTYASAGDFTVILNTHNACNTSDSASKPITIVSNTPVISNFNASASQCAGINVKFTDTSTGGPTAWDWNFGDGVGTSAVQNPLYAYSQPGTYNVTLKASNNNCANNAPMTKAVKIIGVELSADFTSTNMTCINTAIQFTDTSQGTPESWQWSFGDGSTSDLKNPTHSYSQAGTYNVMLLVTNSCGSFSQVIKQVMIISQHPVAHFTFDSPTCTGSPVQFHDTSTDNPTSWNWAFGDGGTSNLQNPIHTYNYANSFTATLTASNACGSSLPQSGLLTVINDSNPVAIGNSFKMTKYNSTDLIGLWMDLVPGTTGIYQVVGLDYPAIPNPGNMSGAPIVSTALSGTTGAIVPNALPNPAKITYFKVRGTRICSGTPGPL